MSNVLDFTRALAAYQGRALADSLSASVTREVALRVQKRLLALGFKLPRYGADGAWGQESAAALLAFKGAVGLPANGDVTNEVLEWLDNASPGDVKDAVATYNASLTAGPPATVTALAPPQRAPAGPAPKPTFQQVLFPPGKAVYAKPGVWLIVAIGVIALAGILSNRRDSSAGV